MSAEVISPNSKVWKKSLMLFGFQCISGLLTGILIYIFTDLIKILPDSFMTHGSSIPAIIFGAYCYGYWEEKLHPGILDSHLTKKISRIVVFGQFIFILIFLFMLMVSQSAWTLLSFGFFMTISVFMALMFLIYYWLTVRFINLGIKKHKKK